MKYNYWFEILKDDDLLKGFESPFWLERKAELDAMGVKLIEEGEPQTEFIGRNTFQIVAEHVASGTKVVVKWMRKEKKGNRPTAALKKVVRQAFSRRGVDITGSGLTMQNAIRSQEHSDLHTAFRRGNR